jgi:hypothetical protein
VSNTGFTDPVAPTARVSAVDCPTTYTVRDPVVVAVVCVIEYASPVAVLLAMAVSETKYDPMTAVGEAIIVYEIG